MKLTLTVLLLTMTFCLFGQDTTDDTLPIFAIVDQSIEFPGGPAKFREYVVENLRHPKKPKHGKIFVYFAIDTTGLVMPSQTKIIRPNNDTTSDKIHELYDSEVIRVVNESPAWIPARHRGKKVRQQWTTPIIF